MEHDSRASIPDVVDAFCVDSRSMPGTWHRVEFRYEDGSWTCSCPAGESKTRCSHVATCEYWGRYDRTLAWLRRLDLNDLTDIDRRYARTGRGEPIGRLGIDVDLDALGDVLAERLAGVQPSTRSGVAIQQAREELFG